MSMRTGDHRRASTAATILIMLVAGGCGLIGAGRNPQPLPPDRIADSVTGLEGQDGMGHAVPGSGAAGQGILYRFDFYSHCGIYWWIAWDFDGSFWDPVAGTRVQSFEEINNPVDHGTIELTGADQARYTSSSGYVVELKRSSDQEREGMLCI